MVGLVETSAMIFCCDLLCGTKLLVQDFSWPGVQVSHQR